MLQRLVGPTLALLRGDPHLILAFLAISPLHNVVHSEVRAVGVNDALTLPAVCRLIRTDLAVAIDGSGLCSCRGSANHLLKQLHDFAARAGGQLWRDANFKKTLVAILPLNKVVDDDFLSVRVYEALALPAFRHVIIADLSVAIDASDLGSHGSSANEPVEQLHNFAAIAGR